MTINNERQDRGGNELYKPDRYGKLIPIGSSSERSAELGISDAQLVFIEELCRTGELMLAVKAAGITRLTALKWLKERRVAFAVLQQGSSILMMTWVKALMRMNDLLDDPDASASAKVALFRHLDERVMGRAAESEEPLGEQLDPAARAERFVSNLIRLKGIVGDVGPVGIGPGRASRTTREGTGSPGGAGSPAGDRGGHVGAPEAEGADTPRGAADADAEAGRVPGGDGRE